MDTISNFLCVEKMGWSDAYIEQAILQGTMKMRTHIELDPQIGLKGFFAIQQLKHDYAWALDIQLCVFPQEELLNNPGTEELLHYALTHGAEVIGGCPYTDTQPLAHIERIFEISHHYKVDIDFHLDFDLQKDMQYIHKVIIETKKYNKQGHVTLGHVTRLSTLDEASLVAIALALADAGIHITVLPSTDLFLNGRDYFALKPRGVAPIHILAEKGVICSLSTNNVLNPFTPFGDASLIRQANLYANIAQLSTTSQLNECLEWVSSHAAQLLNLKEYGLKPGCRADFIVFDNHPFLNIVGAIARPLMGFKAGVKTFEHQKGKLLPPSGAFASH